MANRFKRDNIPGIGTEGDSTLLKIFLAPGMVIQWLLYISAGFGKNYSYVRFTTRVSRSPLLTYALSIFFWIGTLLLLILYIYTLVSSAK